MHSTSHSAWLWESRRASTEREDVIFEKMKKAKLGKAPSPSAVSCQGLIQCSARVSGSLCSAGACRHLQQSWLAWLGWCVHSDEPASCLLSLEQRPVNPWTRSTLESFQRSLNSLPEAAGLCSGSGRKVMQTSDPDVLPGLPGHACNLPGSSQKPICCRRNHSTTAALNCTLGYACLPQGEGQLPKHTCLMAACWGKTPCARAAAQLCHMPAQEPEVSRLASHQGQIMNQPALPPASLPPSPSRVRFLCLPPAPQPGIGEGFPSLQRVGCCWFATEEPASTSCGWLLY